MHAYVLALLLLVAPALAADEPKSHIDIPVGDMKPGTLKIVRWKGRPFIIVRTSDAMLADLRAQTPHTWSARSIADTPIAYFAFSGMSSARGCPVRHAPSGAPRYAPERLWQGGFYDACRFGEWDYAGRAIKQYDDQDEAMRRPDLDEAVVEIRAKATLRLAR